MRNLRIAIANGWARLKLRFQAGSPAAALDWDPALRAPGSFAQDQRSVTTGTGPVECVTTTAVVTRNLLNEYLARLSAKQPPKEELLVEDYVRQLDRLGAAGRKYRYPSHEPAVRLPLVGAVARAGWMHPRRQLLAALKQMAAEFKEYYGCSFTVEQHARNSYADLAEQVRQGHLVIIHLMREPDPESPGQRWIGGCPHTLGPVLRLDADSITLLNTNKQVETWPRARFMKLWGTSSRIRLFGIPWLPVSPFYAYTPPRTMTVVIPDRACVQ